MTARNLLDQCSSESIPIQAIVQNAMLNELIRVLDWLSRFFTAVSNFGLPSAIKLLLIHHRSTFPEGAPLFVAKLGRMVYYRGAQDIGVMSHLFKRGYRIIDTKQDPVRYIVDAGANIGDETLRFRHFHPDATIIALEPELKNFKILLLNTVHDSKIHPLQNGLWSHECMLQIVSGPGNEAFRVFQVEDAATEGDDNLVEAVSVMSIMERFGMPEIDILKMDIEGAEYFVFGDYYQEWVSKVKVFIVECPDHDRPGTTSRMFHALGNQNFNCFVHGENLVLIRNELTWSLGSDLFLSITG